MAETSSAVAPSSPPPAPAQRQPPARVLVVEDEPGIVDFLKRGLEGAGFAVDCALDGNRGELLALRGGYDAVVLDLLLPGRSGLELLDSIRRAKPLLPVLILSALGELDDRLRGLEGGAVDYIVKPFSVAELVARLRAQLRASAQALNQKLFAADIELDLLTRKARRGGRTVNLSTTEFELLAYLMRNEGRAVAREEILGGVWGYEHDPATNIVDVYIGYLRRKLALPENPAPIHTVRAVGYRLGGASR